MRLPWDCIFVVDAGGDRQDIQKYIKQLKRCDVFVLTHGHFDHTSGLILLKRQFPSIPIAIHEEDACYLGEKRPMFWGILGVFFEGGLMVSPQKRGFVV